MIMNRINGESVVMGICVGGIALLISLAVMISI